MITSLFHVFLLPAVAVLVYGVLVGFGVCVEMLVVLGKAAAFKEAKPILPSATLWSI